MTLDIFIGYDAREAVTYHVCVNSLIRQSTAPIAIHPLALNCVAPHYTEQVGGASNTFNRSRFLVPLLKNFQGWAIYMDSDCLALTDIHELKKLADPNYAVQVVQHDYQTCSPKKYLNNPNLNYPRKNWSSVVLWNCAHEKNQQLTSDYVGTAPISDLHTFSWLNNSDIGKLAPAWNWLVGEYPTTNEAKLLHYTLGAPCFKEYADTDTAESWHSERTRTGRPESE